MRIVYDIKKISNFRLRSFSAFLASSLIFCTSLFSQPPNDTCTNASIITIPNSGFALGTFSSTIYDISAATVQTGETFAPAIFVAGQTQKSIWYKFTLPTTRSVRVTLAQPGSAIAAGDAGFTVYKTNTCLPAVADISTKLTPLGIFGNTYHPCVEPGDYLVQVSGKATANGPIYVTVETATTVASYDVPAGAYDFGAFSHSTKFVDYSVDCQSLDDPSEICTGLSNYQDYSKSTWHTFTTAAYFDYLALLVASPVGNFSNGIDTIGYILYQGDARTSPVSSLTVVSSCDSLLSDGYTPAYRIYRCSELQANTTYSIQLFFHQNFNKDVRVGLSMIGIAPTQAPEPILSSIPASNILGVLPASPTGVTTTATDYLGCNSQHILHPCDPSLPSAGTNFNGVNYTLSTFFRFSISSTSELNINATNPSGYPLLFQLYKQDVTNTCSTLDTSNIISRYLNYNQPDLTCLAPGNYILQVSGSDTIIPNAQINYFSIQYYNPYFVLSNLGEPFTLNINTKTINPINRYSLNVPGAFDTLNSTGGVIQPLTNGVYYNTVDTFGCANTVLPWDTTCSSTNKKAMYSQFAVADSGIVKLYSSGPPNYLWNKLYQGDANALANAQNIHSFPERITGLTPYSECLKFNFNCEGAMVCLVPGTYSFVTFADESNIGLVNQAQVQFTVVNTNYNSPANAEDMGDILSLIPNGGSVQSSPDYFSCNDNAVPINGYLPCDISGRPATKAIYRQFYLSAPASISISGIISNYCSYGASDNMTLFSGRATDGIAALTVLPPPWQCFQSTPPNTCNNLPTGWYTIVSYGSGPSYDNPFQNLNQLGYSSYTGLSEQITISISVCSGPKYNRPYKAAVDSVTNQPFLIEWAPRAGSSAAYPKTDTTYPLYQENFNCTVDTPFLSHPIQACSASLTKVAYYVFQTTQESFLLINTFNFWATVYQGDIRTDSTSFATITPIQPCLRSEGHIQLCRLQPGIYTLVVFATEADACSSVTPTIYIDQVGYSRFDHANNAYDFGAIPPDSIYHNGKFGDINPLNAGRAPSNDFFYCTTGARQDDPNDAACFYNYLPGIYDTQVTYLYSGDNPYDFSIPRRNLWYTFVVSQAGTVRIKVQNKTIGKQFQYSFAVYKSDVDGTLPFTTVVNTGQVDSTTNQGLTLVATNPRSNCFANTDEAYFSIEPCRHVIVPERYYILVENVNSWPFEVPGMNPNSQVEVSVLFDSADVVYPGDYCSSPVAAGINGPGTNISSVSIDCHTIGTDYGEFNPTLTCPAGAVTQDYKTSWFRIDITGTDTLDVTTYLTENTNASSSDIKYRLMNGDCGAMQERSCVQDALTHDTYKCLPPGSYYIQVFTPVKSNIYPYPDITGTIDLHVSAVVHTDTCAPLNNCLSNAVFAPQFDCNVSEIVTFENYSTYGSAITYTWDFDYAGQSSTAVSPQFIYPVLSTDQTYNVSLTVQNNSCVPVGQAIYSTQVTIPGRPVLELGNDTTLCTPGSSLVLDATTWPGTNYEWQDGSIDPTFNVVSTGTYWIRATYNGCVKTDTTRININPITHLVQTIYLCGNDSVFLNSARGQGESYLWSTGEVTSSILVKTPGVYINTLNWNGCTIRDTFNVISARAPFAGSDTTICYPLQSFTLNAATPEAISYIWQDNSTNATYTVTAPGTYWVAIWNGSCYNRDTINVFVSPETITDSFAVTICEGETYLLPWGGIVGTAGIYRDTLRNLAGCDSVRRVLNLQVEIPQSIVSNPVICQGQTYILPWGTVVNTPGVYMDTLRSVAGCDSVRRTVNLAILTVSEQTFNPIICEGATYPLPWGSVAGATGTYADTIVSTFGCDSVIRTVNLTVQSPVSQTFNPVICEGDSYALPWGPVVFTAGVFSDTLYYTTGCDSVIRTVNIAVQSPAPQIINPVICQGMTYILPWGTAVNATGVYEDTLYYTSGCDSLYRTVNLTVQSPVSQVQNAIICQGSGYTLPWGTVVNTAGVYKDTLYYTSGCDSLYRTVNLTVQSSTIQTFNPVICEGSFYTLPWGLVVTTTGVYIDTLRYTTGCDSLRRIVNLTVEIPVSIITHATICDGQDYVLPWGTIVNTPGVYMDTLYSQAGCDSIRRTVNLTILTATSQIFNPVICEGSSYTLPWGGIVDTAGTYRDTLYSIFGCDSVRQTVNLIVQSPTPQTFNPAICAGQTYTLPWGPVVTTAGIYGDTLRYFSGCDSIWRTVNLTVQSATLQTLNPVICEGDSYTLPWGPVVIAAGTYRDTLHYSTGCDSVLRTVNLTVQSPIMQNLNPVICEGDSYTLPWGPVVIAVGTYRDTLHYYGTDCDSIWRTVNLTVQSSISQNFNPTICEGDSYALPWGPVVTAAGTYRDTLHYTTGCDSVRRTVTLIVQSPISQNFNPIICEGNSYTLPWGGVVTAAGIYRDTLHYGTGCDSVWRTVNLTVQSSVSQTFNPVICEGDSYTLPWGVVVTTSGAYRDTLHYTTGCDSVTRTVNLTVQSPISQIFDPVICEGDSYTLPWGLVATVADTYRDTLHYTTGCDSVRRTVTLIVQSPISQNFNPIICEGDSYTLPWGPVVTAAGVYRDTLRYTTGCDSIWRTVNLTVQSVASEIFNPIICEGNSYMLPWGPVVTVTGVYRDTLRYTTGCDSIWRTVNLTVQSPVSQTFNPVICEGDSYALPWGPVVFTAGVYRDTLHYTTGCDSVRRTVNLIVQLPASQSFNPIICEGDSYTLPWGPVVAVAGTYHDTLRYSTGCDSVWRRVNLVVQSTASEIFNPVICAGDSYVLPWGPVVTMAGAYHDTLRYSTGCDSIRKTVNLFVQSSATQVFNPVICQGGSYVLPWGPVVTAAGTYRDTLYYTTGCDSIWRTVNLQVTAADVSSVDPVICSNEFYSLPWGIVVNTPGIYRDTVKTSAGCDSLIRVINLTVNPVPFVSITKSNDVNCFMGVSQLFASGGRQYEWSPGNTLSNPLIQNPVASPGSTTMYHVKVTSDKGCEAEDSIKVIVYTNVINEGFELPNAFTPNHDGKNDCFGVMAWGQVNDLRLSVYNRWGELVFYTTDSSKCWDGTFKGVEQPSAVFVYQVSAKTNCGNVYRKGTVTLIR